MRHTVATELPKSDDISVEILARVFADTTTSYKYLFFHALLESFKDASFSKRAFPMEELVVGMVAKAWYPVRMFKLSLGYLDKVESFMSEMTGLGDRPVPRSSLRRAISRSLRDHRLLVRYVPYRILSPFFQEQTHHLPDHQKNSAIRELAHSGFDSVKPLFRFLDDDSIELHPLWADYFFRNLAIVSGWAELQWVAFLESRNPSLPGILQKARSPLHRSPLTKQKAFWQDIISRIGGKVRCIYSGQELDPENLQLDHILPWTFVCHDSLWNLIPATPEANLAKGNQLPDPSYIQDIGDFHFRALTCARATMLPARWKRAVASYVGDLRISEAELHDEVKFKAAYARAVRPQLDVARSIGFQPNWRWTDSSACPNTT